MSKPKVMIFEDLPRESLLDGTLTRTAVRSADSLVTINWITPDVPRLELHHHPFDQLSMVFAGTLVLQIDDEEFELGPGSAILIPADAPHTAWVKGSETVLNVDVFAPAREDYLFLAEHQEGWMETNGIAQLELAYLGFGVSDVASWEALLKDVIGLMPGNRNADGSLGYRMDGFSQRIFLQPSGKDDIVATGFVALDRHGYDTLCDRLKNSGTKLEAGSPALAQSRCVEELVTFFDPFGNALELCFGQKIDPRPFESSVAASGFVTGDMGLGHVVLLVPDLQAAISWYEKVMGLRLSDTASEKWGDLKPIAAFMNCNRRHHSLGLAAGIPSTKQAIHVEFHVPSIDDVGLAFDRAQDAGVRIVRTLGRHPDGVFSFYAETPSGFEWEIGTGGFDIDEAWKAKHSDTFSLWGHKSPLAWAATA